MGNPVKTLKVNGTNFELEDERLSTGNTLPTSGMVANDIFLKFNDSGVKTSNG